jgi:phenylpropionate dioxygenase-like ring-hydroxylating dioxygenase large terminal subunit
MCAWSSGLVFISFAADPLDFDPSRAIPARQLRAIWLGRGEGGASRDFTPSQANWKLAVENYAECYHCGPAHPEYSQTHALEKPLDKIEALNSAMEARTCALGIEVVSGDRWQTSAAGQEAIHTFRYALYDGVSTGSEDGKRPSRR